MTTGLAFIEGGTPGVHQDHPVLTSYMAYCNFQRRLLACASTPRTAAVAACKPILATSTAAFFRATAS